jgi:Xaa-Pro aminopeptidase
MVTSRLMPQPLTAPRAMVSVAVSVVDAPGGKRRAPLPPMDVAVRVERLRDEIQAAGCDGLLVTKIENVRYLTGFSGSAAKVLVGPRDVLVVTDGRYRDQVAEDLEEAGVEAIVEVGTVPEQLQVLRRFANGVGRLGLEAKHATWDAELRYQEAFETSKLVATVDLVETLRLVKDDGEVARIERAADIADVALAQVKSRLAERPTESEFAAELEFEMRQRGADGPAFETIVASGPNSAKPHARPTSRRIEPSELVVVDFGALVDGYRSDITRTLCVDEPANRQLLEMVEAVFSSQRAGLRAVAPGRSCAEVDGACRDSFAEAGLADAFVHGTGHGVGLEIHEAPALATTSRDVLEAGSVVTVEPGLYFAGVGGARIEDTLLVTATGSRLLTKSTKDLTL